MAYPKRLIEVDLPIARISAHARREKSIRHGHISTLHIWWARRPLAACRAVICASLWPDPEDLTVWLQTAENAGSEGAMGPEIRAPRGCKPSEGVLIRPRRFLDEARKRMRQWAERHAGHKGISEESFSHLVAIQKDPGLLDDPVELRRVLLDFIADFANWDNSTDSAFLETARALTQAAHEALGGEPGSRPLVVDPFAGGGSIPLEALRVGADAFASDLNPVAVLLNKVVLEYIPKHGQKLADEVRKWGRWVKEQAEKELAEFYPCLPAGRRRTPPAPTPGTFYAYVLKCADGCFYKGHTDNLQRRFRQHENGEVDYSSARLPVELWYYETFRTREGAVTREKYFKSGSGREWLAKKYEEIEERPIAYLWARTILSEAPDAGEIPVEVPLMRSLWLAKKAGRKRALRWVRLPAGEAGDAQGKVKTKTIEVTYVEDGQPVAKRVKRPLLEIFEPKKESDVEGGTVARGSATCPVTGYTTKVDSVRAQLKQRRGGAADARLFAVVTTRDHETGRFYRLPTKADQAAFDAAAAELERRERADGTERSQKGRAAGRRSAAAGAEGTANRRSLVPDEVISLNELRRISVPIYGMERWGDLFSPRQALALTTLARLVRDVAARCLHPAAIPTEPVADDIDIRASGDAAKSGLAKRLIEAAEAMFIKNDAESALLPLCAAVDRMAKDVYGVSGRSAYQRFVHDRMELITRAAFNGTGILNMNFAINPIHDDKGREIEPHVRDTNGIGFYSFQQVLYHIVRCKLAHECEIPAVLRDSGRGSGQIRMGNGSLYLPFDAIALGLLVALLAEVDLQQELRGSIFESVAWKGVPLIKLSGKTERALAISRGEDAAGAENAFSGPPAEFSIPDGPVDGLAEAVATCLALALGRQADATSSLCRWHLTGEKHAATFGRQALGMVWDFSEVPVLSDMTGGFPGALEWVEKVLSANAATSSVAGHIEQASATVHPLPDDAAAAFVTDPPYYDAVPYAYLSDFFYVWMRRTLDDVHPALFGDTGVPKDAEIVVDRPHKLSQSTKGIAFYERELTRAFAEGRRVLAPAGVGTIVFASKTTAALEAIWKAVIDAGFVVTGSWPIDTEMETRVAAQGQARLGSSVHIACRPRENPDGSVREDMGNWRDVLAELPKRIHAWMPRLAAEGVVGADAIFACLGPALEIFSRYSRVEKASGEVVTLGEYLEQVWAAVSKEALSMLFADADASGLEPDARLTAMWLWTGLAGRQALGAGKRLTAESAEGRGEKKKRQSEDDEPSDDDDDDQGAPGNTNSPRTSASSAVKSGYVLEYDAARKIAQGLGAHLDKLPTVVEVKSDKARLLGVAERTRHLFGKDAEAEQPRGRRRKKSPQLSLFAELEAAEEAAGGSWAVPAGRQGGVSGPSLGATVLDRIHQAMILFASGRGEALKRFLVEDGAGADARFWKLAQSLSALYPAGSDEKRWVDGVLGRKKGLGL